MTLRAFEKKAFLGFAQKLRAARLQSASIHEIWKQAGSKVGL